MSDYSSEFERDVIRGIAQLAERQTNQHEAVIGRLDVTNGRLNKHDDEIKAHQSQLDKATGFWKGINWIKAIIVVAGVEAAKFFYGHSKP